MNPFTIVGLKALVASKAARLIAAVACGVLLFALGHCQGERNSAAAGRITLDDSIATINAAAAKAADAQHAADLQTLGGMQAALELARDSTQRATTRAESLLARVSVVHPVSTITVLKPTGETLIGSSSGAAETSGDTVRFASIQRQGDARVYTVPQFVVDLGAELRKAIGAAQSTIAQQQNVIAQAERTIGDDTKALAARDAQIAALTDAEKTAKSNAGQNCRLLMLIPCPTRNAVFVVTLIGAGVGGALLDHQLAKK